MAQVPSIALILIGRLVDMRLTMVLVFVVAVPLIYGLVVLLVMIHNHTVIHLPNIVSNVGRTETIL